MCVCGGGGGGGKLGRERRESSARAQHHEFMTHEVPPFTQMINFSVPAGMTRFGEEYVNVSAFAFGL